MGGRLSVLPSHRREERGNWAGFDACDISMCKMPGIGQSQSRYIFLSFLECMVGLGGGHLIVLTEVRWPRGAWRPKPAEWRRAIGVSKQERCAGIATVAWAKLYSMSLPDSCNPGCVLTWGEACIRPPPLRPVFCHQVSLDLVWRLPRCHLTTGGSSVTERGLAPHQQVM